LPKIRGFSQIHGGGGSNGGGGIGGGGGGDSLDDGDLWCTRTLAAAALE
jgi:hypothetical protein